MEVLQFFGGVRLPLGIRTVSAVETRTSTEKYTHGEAMEVAYYRLAKEMETELFEAQILRKTFESELSDDAYVLRCRVRCIENIGETAEIELG